MHERGRGTAGAGAPEGPPAGGRDPVGRGLRDGRHDRHRRHPGGEGSDQHRDPGRAEGRRRGERPLQGRGPAEEASQRHRGPEGLDPGVLPHPTPEQEGDQPGRHSVCERHRPPDAGDRQERLPVRLPVDARDPGGGLRGLQGSHSVRRRRVQRDDVRVWPDGCRQDIHHGRGSRHAGRLPEDDPGNLQSHQGRGGALPLHRHGLDARAVQK
mmetsp:Transcript_13700/g.38932  ORF Transcript_13700/g.38932 Transcript_13700/m.38932 type:complete len:212 (+) Transcript_13700:1501-2136(+)